MFLCNLSLFTEVNTYNMDLKFNNKCRACLAENETMLSLFDIYEHDLTLAMILQSCVSTEVSANDGLPSRLCDSCILVLTQFYNFTVVYEESDKQLRSLVKKNKRLLRIDESNVLTERDLNGLSEQGGFESETSELISSDSNEQLLHNAMAVEVAPEDVAVSCEVQNDLQFYEFKNIDYNIVEQQDINNASEYEVQEAQDAQEFKKEIMSAQDLEDIDDGNNDYLEIHIADTKPMLVKQEPDVFKRENPIYEEIVKYECTICGEAHLYGSSFQQHMRVKHHMPDVECKDYASHVRIKVNHRIDVTDRSAYQLSQALAELSDGEPTHKCKFCDKRFHVVAQLQQHAKVHDANKKYVCEVCGARFIRKTYLDDHMEGHSTEKKHVCKFCGKAFRRRTVLRAHKRVHTHPNHYVCELCGRAFTNSSTLKTHKSLIHIKERNFKCVICGLLFPLKSTLNKHVLRHQKRENGEKGFNCTQCEMEYRDKSSLKRHIETKHQGRIQLIPCPDCPKKYTSKANLMKHRRRHHAVILDNTSPFTC